MNKKIKIKNNKYFDYKEFYNYYKDNKSWNENNGLEEHRIPINHIINQGFKNSPIYDNDNQISKSV